MSIFARASRRAPEPVPLVPPLPVPLPSATPPRDEGPRDEGRRDEGRRDEGRLAVLGRSAWYLLGLTLVAALVLWAVARLAVVTVPVVLALLPAAALVPLVNRLKRWRLRPAPAASVVLIGLLALLALGISTVVPLVGPQLGPLREAARSGVEQLRAYLAAGPFGLPGLNLADVTDRVQNAVSSGGERRTGRFVEAATVAAETTTAVLLGLVTLFFSLKDGARIAAWLRDLWPRRYRNVTALGDIAWTPLAAPGRVPAAS